MLTDTLPPPPTRERGLWTEVEFTRTGEKIKSSTIRGSWVKRVWLNPEKLPSVQACLAELLR